MIATAPSSNTTVTSRFALPNICGDDAKISQLVKNNSDTEDQSNYNYEELSSTLEEVVTKLVSKDCVVEVEKA